MVRSIAKWTLLVAITMVILSSLGIVLLWRLDESVHSAEEILIKSRTVTGIGVGPGNLPSIQTWAYSRIMRSRAPIQSFERVFEHGQLAGKVYALGAFALLDESRFRQALRKLETFDQTETKTVFGCFYSDHHAKDALIEYWIEQKGYVLVNLDPPPPREACLFFDVQPTVLDRLRKDIWRRTRSPDWGQEAYIDHVIAHSPVAGSSETPN